MISKLEKIIRLLCCILALLPLNIFGQGDLPKELASAVKQSGFARGNIGLFIQDVESTKPVVSYQSHIVFNPASVIKLVTTAAALDILGSGYRWTNEVWYSGRIVAGTLHGDLFFRGNGDPYLTPERFWRLLNRLSIYGIRKINGDIVLDNTYFSPKNVDYSAFDDQPYRTYNVGPNAVLVGFQATEFHLSVEGQKVIITPFPTSPKLQILNNIKLVNNDCGSWQKRLKIRTQNIKQDTTQVNFSGQYARSCDRRTLYRRVTGTQDHFQHFFLPLWRQLGSQFEGSIKHGEVPTQAKLIIEDTSISLGEAIRLINKFSNNVMTRQVLLSMGAQALGPPGTTAKGIAVINTWLKQQQIDSSDLILDNGAGLSRKTRISADLLGNLLHFVFKQPYMPEFMASMPVAGYDGAMENRFHGEPLVGHAHIKTGLLDFVQSMAGYVTNNAGKRYVVVLLINDPRAHTRAGKRLQNKIIRWAYQLGSKSH